MSRIEIRLALTVGNMENGTAIDWNEKLGIENNAWMKRSLLRFKTISFPWTSIRMVCHLNSVSVICDGVRAKARYSCLSYAALPFRSLSFIFVLFPPVRPYRKYFIRKHTKSPGFFRRFVIIYCVQVAVGERVRALKNLCALRLDSTWIVFCCCSVHHHFFFFLASLFPPIRLSIYLRRSPWSTQFTLFIIFGSYFRYAPASVHCTAGDWQIR